LNRFQLFLETTDPELFRKATSELGTMFYRLVNGDGVKQPLNYEIVYFSGSRIARFTGTPTNELVKLCKVNGYEVSSIDLDEAAGTLKVKQKKEEVSR
jgi:hypothetical protein